MKKMLIIASVVVLVVSSAVFILQSKIKTSTSEYLSSVDTSEWISFVNEAQGYKVLYPDDANIQYSNDTVSFNFGEHSCGIGPARIHPDRYAQSAEASLYEDIELNNAVTGRLLINDVYSFLAYEYTESAVFVELNSSWFIMRALDEDIEENRDSKSYRPDDYCMAIFQTIATVVIEDSIVGTTRELANSIQEGDFVEALAKFKPEFVDEYGRDKLLSHLRHLNGLVLNYVSSSPCFRRGDGRPYMTILYQPTDTRPRDFLPTYFFEQQSDGMWLISGINEGRGICTGKPLLE